MYSIDKKNNETKNRIMKQNDKRVSFVAWIIKEIKRILYIMLDEYRLVFKDSGLVVIFIGATLGYPLLYASIYKNETIREMPIAVVDNSHTSMSRNLAQKIDATPDLQIISYCQNLQEIKRLFQQGKIHGAIYIPNDYSLKIHKNQQTTVSIYADMSRFMYYRTMILGANYAILDAGRNVKLERMSAMGITGRAAEVAIEPMSYEGNILYNHSMGFASFLLPALLIIILHQTLFFGITMVAGTAREERNNPTSFLARHPKKFFQSIIGKALCYFTLYMLITPYVLLLIPRLFGLPHIGAPKDIMLFMIPFIFAVIFFSMTLSVFMKNRETGMITLIFFSVILLFLSGLSWPSSNIHWFWKTFSILFPSTYGIDGYLKINSMGATLSQVKTSYLALCTQAIIYFFMTLIVYRIQWKYELYAQQKR